MPGLRRKDLSGLTEEFVMNNRHVISEECQLRIVLLPDCDGLESEVVKELAEQEIRG